MLKPNRLCHLNCIVTMKNAEGKKQFYIVSSQNERAHTKRRHTHTVREREKLIIV